jgi:copper homeostasis protein
VTTVLVEACVDSVASAVAAERGGARRLELCDNLHDGGTTPSAGMISAVKAAVGIPVFVIVRPRGGGFVYAEHELGVMRLDIEAARLLGADGVAAGVLTPAHMIDEESLRLLLEAAGELPMTFHRAFDVVHDQGRGLESLMRLGVARVLTSGGARTAIDGAASIAALVRRGGPQIAVMAGGGVREETVQELVHRTGVQEVHVRGARVARFPTQGPGDALRLRKPFPDDESAWEETDEARIREFVRLANG